MKENGYGRFVFTTSGSGIFGNFGQSNYAAAKTGLVGLSNVLSVEGEKYNIRSNVIAPVARTRMTEALLGPLAEALDPELITPLVSYLCSEDCDFSHEVFDVGGGRYARVFIGLGGGWDAPAGEVPTPEDIRDNLDDIRSTENFIIPSSIAEETAAVMETIKRRTAA